jgi:hypothetical protein
MLNAEDLMLPRAVTLTEVHNLGNGFISYIFTHVEGRSISVLIPDDVADDQTSNVSLFVRVWAEG